jgi:lysophospholipase L1-like esterase
VRRGLTVFHGLLAAGLIAALAAGCAGTGDVDAPAAGSSGSGGEAAVGEPTDAPTGTPQPTLTPAVTATPLVTQVDLTFSPPSSLPADQRDYELCVSIASDSNGYGHVSFLIPEPEQDPDPVAITYITPLAKPLQAHLDAVGLDYLEVRDRSLSAGGLTIESANYLESDQLARLREDRCQFVVVTPFFPDVAVDLSRPEDYLTNMGYLVGHITRSSPASRILILNFYQANPAEFTISNMGRGVRPERIAAFNEALAASCADPNGLGGVEQVTCIDIQPFFEDMGMAHVLGETTREDFEAALDRENSYTAIVWDYFERHPDGTLVGDGIHLSLAGRDRLAERLAGIMLDMSRMK